MAESRDAVAEQLNRLKTAPSTLTSSTGAPIEDKLNSLTVGPRGPILLQDFTLLDELIHFGRERIPERVVHAKGAGAFGYLEVTHDISKFCKAKLFDGIGKRTALGIRFSTVGGERGSADTARDPRGFAVKFYTEEGNWDLVGNNTPIFFIRDPILFPSFVHTQKRNPATNCKDSDMFWDFISLRPETTHQVMFLFSDRGTPDGFRRMNGYGSHTFKLVNSGGEAVYCKFHLKTKQGIQCLMAERAGQLEGDDPDYATRDLFNAIEEGDFPEWDMFIQVMTFEEAETWEFNPFDVTKVWPHGDFPLLPVGKVVLNKNPQNYFAEVEQIAFSPAHLVPGIEASPDKLLQGRLISYVDTHHHRLGTNYSQIPVNCPFAARVKNYQRDGPMTVTDNQSGAPNYFPNSFSGPNQDEQFVEQAFSAGGAGVHTPDIKRWNSADEDNFTQPGIFWNQVLTKDGRQRLCENISVHLSGAQDFIIQRALGNFKKVDAEFGCLVAKLVDQHRGKQQFAGKTKTKRISNGLIPNDEIAKM